MYSTFLALFTAIVLFVIALYTHHYTCGLWYRHNYNPSRENQRYTADFCLSNNSADKIAYAVYGFEKGGFGAGIVRPHNGLHISGCSHFKHPVTITIAWNLFELDEQGNDKIGVEHLTVLPFAGISPPGVNGDIFLEFDDTHKWSLRFVEKIAVD